MTPLTQNQFWHSCDCNMSHPVALAKADLTKPFVYDRKYGLFYVPSGYHYLAMAQLLAFHHDLKRPYDVMKKFNLRETSDCADYWLEHCEGVAFRSSVSKRIKSGKPSSLNAIERRILGEVDYILVDN